MRRSLKLSLFILPLLVPLAAWSRHTEQLSLQPDSKLWVEGKSSLKSWSCKAGQVDAVVEALKSNAVNDLLAGDKAVRSVDVTVPSEKMDCSNGTMNDHMRKALKVGDFPTISFHLASYDVNKASNGITGTLNGTLTLGGVKKPITISATGADDNGALHVLGSYDLNMTDYDLKPPTLLFGRIKVRENVTVKFDLLLKS